MEAFYLNPKTVYEILAAKNVEYLYHANTVLTSLTFIQQKALLSRRYVEHNNLVQTEQRSDTEDKRYNVWDDVFLDGLDLHKRYRTANKYGPVLFVMKLEVLQAPSLPPLLVTKNNPWYWNDQNDWNDRYYSTTKDIEDNYLTGKLDSRIMFTLRSPATFIKLNKYLSAIVIDRPNIIVNFHSGGQGNVGDRAHEVIRAAMDEYGMRHIPIKFRHADETLYFCSCHLDYNWVYARKTEEFKKRYRSI